MEPLRIGIVGVGSISGVYLRNLARFPSTEVVAVADLDEARARSVGEAHGIAKVLSPAALVSDPDVELVLNLTIPKAHYEVAKLAVDAGKHAYNEKPFTVEVAEGRLLLEESDKKGVLVGCAPDTFMGAGIQTARKLIDEGAIGAPVASNAFMLGRGHETWHPSPKFYYEVGGGPMMDMGPYYMTALVSLLGPISRVTGSARASFPTRTITSKPLAGTVVEVETPTHIVGIMEFANGAIGQITTSFDVYPDPLPHITVYGSDGTLIVPDPNGFGGKVLLRRAGEGEFSEVPLMPLEAYNGRGLGVLDMAYALRERRDHRASGRLAFHVLEVMHASLAASDEGRHQAITSTVARPAALAPNEFGDEWGVQ